MQFTSLTLGLSGLLALAQASPVTLRSSNGSGVGPYGLHNAHCEHHFYEVPVASNNTKFVDVEQVYKNQSCEFVRKWVWSVVTRVSLTHLGNRR